MAFEEQDLQSAVAKLATAFSDAELEALDALLGGGDEVAGFGWDPNAESVSFLQRVEAHPGFKPLRLSIVPPTKGVIACSSPDGD